MPKKIITQTQKDYIRAHWGDMSITEIALEFDLAIGTVHGLGKQMGLGPKPVVSRVKPGPKPKHKVHRVKREPIATIEEQNAKARAMGLSYGKYGAMLRLGRI